MNLSFEKQVAAATRSLEEARRVSHRDPSRLGFLVEQLNVLAELRVQEGDFRKAESLYREVLFRIEDTKRAEDGLVTGVNSLLGYLYDRWGKQDQAIEFYQKALTGAAGSSPVILEQRAAIKNNLALIYKNQRELERAEEWYLDALNELVGSESEQSAQAAGVCSNLGVLYYQNLEVERARDMHLKALQIRKGLTHGECSPAELAQNYVHLASVYKALGEFRQAQECMEHSHTLAARASGDTMPVRRRSVALLIDQSA